MRLAIRRGLDIDVYKIEGVKDEDSSVRDVGNKRGYNCTRRHDDIARCFPKDNGGCGYLFANGIAAP